MAALQRGGQQLEMLMIAACILQGRPSSLDRSRVGRGKDSLADQNPGWPGDQPQRFISPTLQNLLLEGLCIRMK